jgi:molecular chaperone GrpE
MEEKKKTENEKSIEIGLDLTNPDGDTVINLEDNPRFYVDILKKELAESEDKYVRLYAEFDNFKRRVQKEKEEIKNNTKVSMISAILDMDNDCSIALRSIKDETAKSGVSLISKKLESFLKSQNIETIQTDVYDEDLHEVISVLEMGELKVVDVVSKGYSIDGKPFRYPKIVLSR